MDYEVLYEVEGFGVRRAGPYSPREEAEAQAADIRSFAGVKYAIVKRLPDEQA